MKIVVDDVNERVSNLHIHLKSADTNYACVMKPLGPDSNYQPIRPGNTARIILEDTCEINSLIRMLKEFEEANWRYFGDWRMYG